MLNSQNKKILDRLVEIASKDKSELSQKNQTHRPSVSLNKHNIKKELSRINDANHKLANRLIKCKPSLNTDRMECDYHQQMQYRDLHIRFRKQLPPLPSMANSQRTSLNPSRVVVKKDVPTDLDDSLDKNQIIQIDKVSKPKSTKKTKSSHSKKSQNSSKKQEPQEEQPKQEVEEEKQEKSEQIEPAKEEPEHQEQPKQEEKVEKLEKSEIHEEVQQEEKLEEKPEPQVEEDLNQKEVEEPQEENIEENN